MQMLDRGLNARLVQKRPSLIRPGSSAAPSLSAQVEAALLGTTGFALDPSDTATMWQDTGATLAVANATDPCRRINTKWGTTIYNFQAPTDAARAPWTGASALSADGLDDEMQAQGSLLAVAQNIPALLGGLYCSVTTLGTVLFGYSLPPSPSANSPRVRIGTNASGGVFLEARRLDFDAQTTITSANGVVSTGSPFTVQWGIDFAGTGALSLWVNGVLVASGTLLGTPGNSENTAALRFYLMRSNNNTALRSTMNFGRFSWLPRMWTAGELALAKAWGEEFAL